MKTDSSDQISAGEEFHKLMRAVMDSVDRETELQRQLRRSKETMMSVALRLQVASKVAAEDEFTIHALIHQAQVTKTELLDKQMQIDIAAEQIKGLNFEMTLLKRQLKEQQEWGANAIAHGGSGTGQREQHGTVMNMHPTHLNDAADAEVDAMMSKSLNIPVLPGTGGNPETATPFERWKMQQFIYTPDTPAASIDHDPEAVSNLMAAMADFEATQGKSLGLLKKTKGSIAQMKGLSTAGGLSGNGGDGEDDNYHSLATKKQSNLYSSNKPTEAELFAQSLPHYPEVSKTTRTHAAILGSNSTKPKEARPGLDGANTLEVIHSDEQFFLDSSYPQEWGAGSKFDNTDLARINLWTTNRPTTASAAATGNGAGVGTSSRATAGTVGAGLNKNLSLLLNNHNPSNHPQGSTSPSKGAMNRARSSSAKERPLLAASALLSKSASVASSSKGAQQHQKQQQQQQQGGLVKSLRSKVVAV